MYYRVPTFIVAVIFTVLAVGCGGQQQQNSQQTQNAKDTQTGQANQKTTQQPAGGTTMMQDKGTGMKSKDKGAGMKGKKNEGGQKAGEKAKGKARGKSGKARTAKGVLGTVKIKESKIYFKPQGGKGIPLMYRPKQVRVTLGGKKARIQDLERGQHARVSYTSRKVQKKDARLDQRYTVHSIKAFAGGGKKPADKQKNKANG